MRNRNPGGSGDVLNDMFEGILQPMHLLIIFVVAVVAFGPSKIPELGKGLGEGIRNFKKAMKDVEQGTDIDHRP